MFQAHRSMALVAALCIGALVARPAAAQRIATRASAVSPGLVDSTTRGVNRALRVRKTLQELIRQPTPANLATKEGAEWDAETRWLRDVERRYRDLLVGLDAAVTRTTGTSLGVAGSVVPGASVTSAAIGGALRAGTGTGSTSDTELINSMQSMNADLLKLQAALEAESRLYQSTAGAVRARHDAAMNSIRNLKG